MGEGKVGRREWQATYVVSVEDFDGVDSVLPSGRVQVVGSVNLAVGALPDKLDLLELGKALE